jgi:hypothetical protein
MYIGNRTYFIESRAYPHARVAQWGTDNGNDCGTYEIEVYSNQLWLMKESPTKPGWYYIYNADEDQKDWRLAKWSAGNTDTGVYEGDYYDDQLWSFTNVTMTNTTMGEYYQINNFLYPQCFMSKWGEEDSDWGTVTGADVDNQQLWALVPRYEATVQDRIIFQADNRNGTLDFTETVTITTGLQLTTKSTISTTVG